MAYASQGPFRCTSHQTALMEQSTNQVIFEDVNEGGMLVRVLARHGRIQLRSEHDGERLPVPRVASYEIDLRLKGEAFIVTPETAAAASFFGIR